MNPWERDWQQPAPWERDWSAPKQPDAIDEGAKNFAADMNPLQSMMVGAGRGFNQIGAGVQQAYNWMTGNQPAQQELASKQAEADKLYKPMQEAHPFASGIGEYLPAMAVPVGAGATALGTVGRMALPGMIQAAVSYGSPEDRLKETALQGVGGAVGAGVGAGIGKVVSPAVRAAGEGVDKLAQTARDAGITLTPAQLTGGKFAQGVESALNTIPWTAGKQQSVKDAQQAAFNKAVLAKGPGADAGRATPDVMGDIAETLGAKLEAGVEGVTVPIADSTRSLVTTIKRNYLERLPEAARVKVGNIASDILDAGESMSGKQYKEWAEDIAAAARNAGDPKTERALYGLRNALDAAYVRAAPPEQSKAFLEARGQYKQFLTVKDALEKGRSETGDIPAKQMYAAFQRFNPGFVKGQGGEMADLVRAGRHYLPDPTPNSGTPFRSAFTNLLSAGALGGAGAGVSAYGGGDPLEGAKLGLLGFGVSKGAQALYNSPAISNHLQRNILPDEWKRIIARGGGLLGAGSAAGLSQ